MSPPSSSPAARPLSIWGHALGYFLCYVPYSALTKALSSGAHGGRPLAGLALLASSTVGTLAAMAVFLGVSGWWRHARRRAFGRVRLPWPGRWTALSGAASAAIIATTTLAYTVEGASILLMMLLMRGGVLVVAPLVDAVSGRRVQPRSWAALATSLAAVGVAGFGALGGGLTLLAGLDVGLYLLGYVVRLRLMSRQAKTDQREQTLRYFVEEQLVSVPLLVAFLAAVAFLGDGPRAALLREGFVGAASRGHLWAELAVGVLSQGTGVFGALILLDGRESSFCVPVNRASSVLAGVVASGGLALWLGLPGVSGGELVGAALVVAAIVLLSLPTRAQGVRAGGSAAKELREVAPSPAGR